MPLKKFPNEEQLKYPINLSTIYRFADKAINYQFQHKYFASRVATKLCCIQCERNAKRLLNVPQTRVLQPHTQNTHTHTHIKRVLQLQTAAQCVTHTHTHTLLTQQVDQVWFLIFLWIGCNNRKHQQDAILMSQAISRKQPKILQNKHLADLVIQLPL